MSGFVIRRTIQGSTYRTVRDAAPAWTYDKDEALVFVRTRDATAFASDLHDDEWEFEPAELVDA